ncbi:ABC transporter permease, partial [Candidatus Acetothermia bacterium]
MRKLAETLLALGLGILVGALVMALWGHDPWSSYAYLLAGALGNTRALMSTISRSLGLVLTGLTFAVGARAGLFNIGAQGQMLLGAVVALSCGLLRLPAGVHLVMALLFAAIAGMIWALPVAVLKLTRGVSEVISTIMLNWVAHWLVPYLVVQKLSAPILGPRTFTAPLGLRFPVIKGELTWALALV